MFVTGRLPLLVGLGVVPVVLLSAVGVDAWLAAGAWAMLCIVLTAVDVAAAADPRAIRVERRLPARARLGERVDTELWIANEGRRSLRGLARDAWQPTAGAPEGR